MIEENFQKAGFNEAVKSNGLQALEWSALAAKLAAVHDLRSVFKTRSVSMAGNFARFSSGAQVSVDPSINETKPSVNLVGSADEKRSGSKAVATEIDDTSVSQTRMTPSDREL